MKRLLILCAVVSLQACVNQVQLAKQGMEASVLRDNPIDYQDMKTYPGNVVCGKYSTNLKKRVGTYSTFIFQAERVNTRPSSLDIAIFCSDDPQRNFSIFTGINLAQCETNNLPTLLSDFQMIGEALAEYEADNHELPRDRQGLEALISPSTVPPIPRRFKPGGYIAEIPSDPWGNPYLYRGPHFWR